VEDFRGQRFFYDGTLHEGLGSIILLATTPSLVQIPRHYVQGWYPVDAASKLSTLAATLIQDGWRPNHRYF
jgi:hypothetical protein